MSKKEKKIAIMGALREELTGLKREIKVSERLKKGKVLSGTIHGKEVVLVETGVGVKKARKMTRFLLENFRVDYIISIGYAGGVKEDLEIGDLISCTKVLWADGETGFKEQKARSCQSKNPDREKIMEVSDKFSGGGINFREGAILTVRNVVESVEEKKWIADTYPVDAVEMETYAIAEEAEERGISMIAFRAISDTAHDRLINLADNDGKISRLKTGLHAIMHPGIIPTLLTMRENAVAATKVLSKAVLKVL